MLDAPFLTVVVDDEPDLLEIISRYLEQAFEDTLEIKTFTNAKEAMAFIQDHEVSIVLADLIMPHYHGLDFTRELMKLERGIQCVVITGDESYSSVFECFLNGVLGYVTKPISLEKVKEAVNRCINNISYWRNIISDSSGI